MEIKLVLGLDLGPSGIRGSQNFWVMKCVWEAKMIPKKENKLYFLNEVEWASNWLSGQRIILCEYGQSPPIFAKGRLSACLTPPTPSLKKRGNLITSLSIYEPLSFDKGEVGWG